MNKKQYIKIPDKEELQEAVEAIKSRGINVIVVDNKEQALEKIIELIPKGMEVSNGSSTTLNEIGFIDYLKSKKHGWRNLHEEILKEKDIAKQMDLRRKSITAEYFLGSVNAIAKSGELVACDASGSRVTAYPFAAKNLILVAGIQKITKNLDEAIKRIREHVYPLENKRAQEAYGVSSTIGKWIIIEREIIPNRITLILIKEKLGF